MTNRNCCRWSTSFRKNSMQLFVTTFVQIAILSPDRLSCCHFLCRCQDHSRGEEWSKHCVFWNNLDNTQKTTLSSGNIVACVFCVVGMSEFKKEQYSLGMSRSRYVHDGETIFPVSWQNDSRCLLWNGTAERKWRHDSKSKGHPDMRQAIFTNNLQSPPLTNWFQYIVFQVTFRGGVNFVTLSRVICQNYSGENFFSGNVDPCNLRLTATHKIQTF